MKIKNLIVIGISAVSLFTITPVVSAEYITAYEKHIDESYIIDTSSIYEVDNNNFNVIVYHYEDNQPKESNTYKFHFKSTNWYITELIIDKDGNKVHQDALVENGSVAQYVLKSSLPYLKKSSK